jgi:predicted nucleotidyltransferase
MSKINIEILKKEILKRLKPLDPYMVVLFGSYAYGNPLENSDLDLYIVTSDNFIPKNWNEKSKIYLKVANLLHDIMEKYPTDLIVHTKEMHKKFLELDSMFSRKIFNQGKIWLKKK